MQTRSTSRFVYEALEGVVLTVAAFLSWPLLGRWLRNLGSTGAERDQVWAGDDLVSRNLPSTTRAIEISAPAGAVWKWVVQFGLGKAGFYSYELLERLVGIPVRNVESIEPSFQNVAVGDEVVLHPKAPGVPIALVEPGKHVVLAETRLEKLEQAPPDVARSWGFYVVSVSGSSCRLIVRGSFEETRKRTRKERAAFALEQPIDFVMELRMLRTVKRLAERESNHRSKHGQMGEGANKRGRGPMSQV